MRSIRDRAAYADVHRACDGPPGPPAPCHYPCLATMIRIGFGYLLLSALTLCPLTAPSVEAEAPVPELRRWEHQMKLFGRKLCEEHANDSRSFDQRLAQTYYDQIRVMYQIAEYTGDASWRSCALAARAVYRDRYVVANQGS